MFDKSALDACLSGLAQHKQLAGVSACIMGPEGSVYDWHYGVRDAAGQLAPDSDTMFGIASMSKSITALCLCILESEGRLRLDDPVCRYLPAFRVPGQPPEAVTLWHLMNHTSGIPPMEPLEWSIVMNTPGRDDDEETLRLRSDAPNTMATIDQIIDYIAHCRGCCCRDAAGEIHGGARIRPAGHDAHHSGQRHRRGPGAVRRQHHLAL